jgi:serine phosphatase RsbU (regulator of sigma subunit)
MIAISLLLLVVVIGLFGVINGLRAVRVIDGSSHRLANTMTRSLQRVGEAKLQLLSGRARASLHQGQLDALQVIVRDIIKQDELVTEAAVMTRSGRLLAHSDPRKVGTQATGILRDFLSVRETKTQSGVVVGGRRSIIFASPIDDTWLVFMACSLKPLEAELAKAEMLRRREIKASLLDTLLVGLLAVGLGLFLTILQSLRISRPIQALARQADQIAGGDLDARVDVTSNDEIGVLGDRFNYMTEQVRALLQEVQNKAAFEQEIEVASALQATLIPADSTVDLPGMNLAAYFRPAAKCGGDWWSYYRIVNDQLLLLVADVTGHGLPSAMITAVVKGAATNMINITQGRLDLTELLRELHTAVLQTGRGHYAMTCFASVFDPETRLLRYANAGHPFPYLHQKKTGEARWLTVRGSLLGDEQLSNYETREIVLNADDVLVWYTDGVIEGRGERGEQFGHKRLLSSVNSHVRLSAGRARDAIVQDIYRFYGNIPQTDDITLVVGKVR